MDLYNTNGAVGIYYPTAQTDAQLLAEELAARLNDLVSDGSGPFSANPGIPTTNVEAVYIGLPGDWGTKVPWWKSKYDFGTKVVSGSNRLNQQCNGNELHIIARNYPLLLRAMWMVLPKLGWRHYMPNGVDGIPNVPSLKYLWRYIKKQTLISTNINEVWSGVVDYLNSSVAGATGILNWSSRSVHSPSGLKEGALLYALGYPPTVGGDLTKGGDPDTWLRHMGWTSSTKMTSGSAWGGVCDFGNSDGLLPVFKEWSDDGTGYTGYYTLPGYRLYTDSDRVRAVALAYANNKVSTLEIEWVSLSVADGSDASWDIDFGDPGFAAKLPVTRQIELANYVASNAGFINTGGKGIVIQAYGRCAERPVPNITPDPNRVCVIIIEAFRPVGRTSKDIIGDYTDAAGNATCGLGLYQYPNSAAWHLADITAWAGSPQAMVDAVNRLKSLPPVKGKVPKVLGGETSCEFGLYGLPIYCYMRMVLDIGRVSADFTLSDFKRHATEFLTDMFPTRKVRTAINNWYNELLDLDHKPLLHQHLVRCLWDQLNVAMKATAAGSDEEKRVTELCKYTRFLDLRNRYEAAVAAGVSSEYEYDKMMEWVFCIRDSGLANSFYLFDRPLNVAHHTVLGLDSMYTALAAPPGDYRGAASDRMAWNTAVPIADDFRGSGTAPDTNWIVEGIVTNNKHGLTDTEFSSTLQSESSFEGFAGIPYQTAPWLVPYRAGGKMRLWLIPGAPAFECKYKKSLGDVYVKFINQSNGRMDAELLVNATDFVTQILNLTEGQLYEVELTGYDTQDRVCLQWWDDGATEGVHHVSFDPGREGDPCGFTTDRSFYFLVPDGITEIQFYASDKAADLQLFTIDSQGNESPDPDPSFQPTPRSYQSHPIGGTGRRVARIAGLRMNDSTFWLLNCPNLFALHPHELLRPKDA